MSDFDPDAFLADFDPDAFLAEKPAGAEGQGAPSDVGFMASLKRAVMPYNTAEVPDKPLSMEESKARTDAERRGMAQLPRIGGAVLGAEGGPVGGFINGVGTTLANAIEGKVDPRDSLQATAMGAIPFGRLGSVGAPVVAGATNYITNKVADLLPGTDPSASSEAKQAGVVAAITAIMPLLGKALGKAAGNVSPEEAARVAALIEKANPVDKSIMAGQRVGMKPIPSMVNRGNAVTDILESIGGAGATKKAFTEANDAAAARAAAKHAKTPGGQLDEEALVAAEIPHAAEYSRVGQIGDKGRAELADLKKQIGVSSSPQEQAIVLDANKEQLSKLSDLAGADIEAWKAAKKEVNRLYSAPYHSQDPEKIASAEALADTLEVKIVKAGIASGDDKLLQSLLDARKGFAQVNDVRRVMNQPGGSIDTRKVANAYQRDPGKMTGELKDVGMFGNQFKDVIGSGRQHMDPGNSGTNTAGVLALLMQGKPLVATAAMLNPRDKARRILMSDMVQNRYVRPDYTPSTSADPKVQAIIDRLAVMLGIKQQNAE